MRTYWLLTLMLLTAFGIVIAGWFLPYAMGSLPAPEIDEKGWAILGQRGDFFGGFVNPFLSFLAFMGVLYSIALQRNDIAENQIEAHRQQFENTFFQMLSVHSRIVEGMDLTSNVKKDTTYNGRDCFKEYYRLLAQSISNNMYAVGPTQLQKIQTGYREFWNNSRQDLGHYFRFLYNFLRYVDESNLKKLPYDEVDPKVKYTRIIRAQISDYELVMIFYNALSDHGGKFRKYVGRYDLLDNLTQDIMREPGHLDFREGMGKVGPLPVLPPPSAS